LNTITTGIIPPIQATNQEKGITASTFAAAPGRHHQTNQALSATVVGPIFAFFLSCLRCLKNSKVTAHLAGSFPVSIPFPAPTEG